MRLISFPGMDGTGDLHQDFLQRMPRSVEAQAVSYPRDQILSYDDLVGFVRAGLPKDSTPYWILAESFSGPIAVRICTENSVGLKGTKAVAQDNVPLLNFSVSYRIRPSPFRPNSMMWSAHCTLCLINKETG
jgi:hypothetical protein